MTKLIYQNSTTPIDPPLQRPAIDVRPIGDLTLILDNSVNIDTAFARSSFAFRGSPINPNTAIALIFDRNATTSATVRNAGTIVAQESGGGDVNSGAILIGDADAVDFVNTGTIRAFNTETLNYINEMTSGVRVVNADTIVFRNEGLLEAEGTNVAAAFLEGRTIDFTNTGTITATPNPELDIPLSGFPVIGLAAAKPGQAANIAFDNSGTIRSVDANAPDNAYIDIKENIFFLYGEGTVDFSNSGLLESAGFNVAAGAQNDGETITMRGTNTGDVYNTIISFTAGGPQHREPFRFRSTDIFRNDTDLPPIAHYGSAEVEFVNESVVDTASLRFGASADDSRTTFINRGDVTGTARLGDVNSINGTAFQFTFVAESGAPLSGSAVTTFVNEGDVTLTEGFYHLTMAASSTHDLSASNSGDIRLDDFRGDTYALSLDQGTINTLILDNGGNFVRYETAYVFDGSLMFDNSGLIEMATSPGVQSAADVIVSGVSDVTIANSGAISQTSRNGTFDTDPYSTVGMVVTAASDLSLVNSAAITASSPEDTDSAAIALFLAERSLTPELGASLTNLGRLRGYDQASDLGSQFDITLAAGGDVIGNGRGSYGIFGVLGATQDSVDDFGDDTLVSPDDSSTIANDMATAQLSIAGGVTVSGGSRDGVAIAFSGAGMVLIDNAGSIVSHGDETGGALVFGREVEFNNHLLQFPESNPTLSLVATVDNAVTGLIDGRIQLDGAGSSFANAGTLRLSSGAASTSSLNGDFTQTATGMLVMRGSDRFDVAGDFALAGNLVLALGAPRSTAIIDVGGNLALDVSLDVTDGGGFGEGVYRLFDYGGTLSGSGLAVGSLPSGTSATVQSTIAHQINLVVGAGDTGPGPAPTIQFWDGTNTSANGAVDGGSGTWNAANTNWTRANGEVNEVWGSRFAVFQGAPGTATIESSGVSATGLQFAIDGYHVEGGSLTLTGSTLRVGDGSTAGAAYTATIASAIGGSVGMEKTDLGTLVLTGANTYTGGTTISSGTLAVNGDAALGAASGGLTLAGGTLRADEALITARAVSVGEAGGTIAAGANAVTLNGTLGGTGALGKTGSGSLTIAGGGNGYTGTLTSAGGALAVSGSLGGNVATQAGTLTVSGSVTGDANTAGDAVTVSPGGEIEGNLVTTANTTTIAGSLGGDADVRAGTATVNGQVGGTLTLASGATLHGTGTIGELIAAGTVGPGNSIGTLTVDGAVTFIPGSTFNLEIAPDGTGDRIAATGPVTLQGGAVVVSPQGNALAYTDGSQYTFITTEGELTGTFSELLESSAFLDFALGYTSNSAFVTVSVVQQFPDVAITFNQLQASGSLAMLPTTAGTDSSAVYREILFLDEEPARAAFDASSGEIYASLLQDAAASAQARGRSLVTRSFAALGEGWGIWGGATGRTGHVASDGNAARVGFDGFGFELGIDYRGAENAWAAGLRSSWLKATTEVTGRASRANRHGWALGGYGRFGSGYTGLSGSLALDYASFDADVTRSIALGALSRTATSMRDGEAFAASAEVRYGIDAGGGLAIGPLVSLDHAKGTLDAFAESGADALNLSGPGDSHRTTRYGGGAFAEWQGATGAVSLSAQYAFGKDRFAESRMALAGATNAPFRVRSPVRYASGALLNASANLNLGNRWQIQSDASALLADGNNDLRARVSVGWRF